MKTLLVGILHSGEREYERCRAALAEQTVDHDVVVIADLPNKAAHDALYAAFNARAADYHRLLKLDADMVLRHPRAVEEMLGLMEPGQAALMTDVADYLSGLLIPGVQCFAANAVRWDRHDDPMMVDPAPRMHGHATRLRGERYAFVDHQPDPHLFQAFRFGVHRALKAYQPDRKAKQLGKCLLHWTILRGVWAAWERDGDERRLLTLVGAEVAMNKQDRALLEDYATGARRWFERWAPRVAQFPEMLRRSWGDEVMCAARFAELLSARPWGA